MPDSAGNVPQPPGLSYGGIPYGSISGQLSLYFGDYEPIISVPKTKDNDSIILDNDLQSL
ncbi:hypothetical protein Phum_PHUM196250 [Pediculus humanus corporis]|uniref:Uncharacterized protein n=1 Tax=Pediculus humanus subsp. corporis TaxID=121224 RepID=E0VH03_PEDHC|nr:uncharacterized protein Phum_PHUM196250 [Pediculus humanus corporis]EEB12659.1 hypothetical protein Phum_PHUM196250 [Pediculus humanus corporis]